MLTKDEIQRLDNVRFDDVDMADWPDMADAFVEYAELDGVPVDEDDLEDIRYTHPEWFYDNLTSWIW